MPKLPSGRYVEIMSDRARYHAARAGLRVKTTTPHADLYALVDILIEHPRAQFAHGHRLGFSGYTLGDVRWLRTWDVRDREALGRWVREAPQVRIIEQARRRLLAEEDLPRERSFAYPERLYSYLRQRVEALKVSRANPRQWRNTLLNLSRQGVKREELDWSGICDFLDRLPDDQPVEKAVIIDAMDFTQVRPRLTHEVVCARGCRLPWAEVAQKLEGYKLQQAGLAVGDDDIGVVRLRSDAPAYRVGVVWRGRRANGEAGDARWFVLGRYGEAVHDGTAERRVLFETRERAVEAAQRNATRHDRTRCDLLASAHYDYMTLYGGERYREWLVTLPEYMPTHFTGHYMERNVLAHIRTKIRTAHGGARVLFVEELQSDWHQALVRKRARGVIPRAPYRKDWPALAVKLMLMHAAAEGLDGIAWADGQVHELRYDKPLPPLKRLYDKTLVDIANALGRPWGVNVGQGAFDTRSPWLHAVRRAGAWRVEGGAGTFATRTRYTKDEAMRLIERHSKALTLSLPMMLFTDDMRHHINVHGLPLFGAKTHLPGEG